MDLPVPVIGRVDLLAQRRGVEDQVVWRIVERHRERPEHLPKGLARGRDIGVRGAAEVGVVAARDDPHLERRARCERREGDRVVVLPDQSL